MKKSRFRNNAIKIPIEFKGYFWDCDFSKINLPKYRKFVLGRLLKYGGLKAMKWLRSQYHIQEVKDYLDERGKKELDSRSYSFWIKCLEIKEIWK
ncbi:MAG: hypothetical protein V2J62_12825 [candidate division KSB1 bacterium]|nr:hypothetical protein [candidate division KSB1 bacterium]